jgi:hypothetical protein
MDRIWAAVNGTKTILVLIGLVIAGALWAQSLSNRVDAMDAFGTSHGRAQERRLQRIERNLIRLGDKWDVPMEEPERTPRRD